MPNWKTHFAISKARTEDNFKELHKWIDENKEDSGVNHRSKNHYYSEELKDIVSKRFGGPIAVSEWLFHIALDNLDTSVTNDWMHNLSDSNIHKFGFRADGFIFYEENEVDDEFLINEFEDYEEEEEDSL